MNERTKPAARALPKKRRVAYGDDPRALVDFLFAELSKLERRHYALVAAVREAHDASRWDKACDILDRALSADGAGK